MNKQINLKLISLMLVIVMIVSVFTSCVIPLDPTMSSTTPQGELSSTTTTRPDSNTNNSTGTTTTTTGEQPDPDDDCFDGHADVLNDGLCDYCGIDVVETIDFYNFNDLHGKFEDGDSHPGVDELTTYLENRKEIDEHTVFLSTGDMWQGGSASNGTHGRIVTDWMNYLGFEAMALGNHEFDWGVDAIKENVAIAEFPILAINIYDNATGQRVDFCESSVMIERGGAQIGIIGAIGDCYSSISGEQTKGINFKTGSALTNLVKAESEKLRSEGADVIIYIIHDGTTYNSLNVNDYYDISLSSGGYVDVVFGGHTHSYYYFTDDYGVPHLQGGGDNNKGITHVELDVNFANGEVKINITGYVSHSQCQNLEKSPIVEDLLEKYWSEIGWMYDALGYNAKKRSSSVIKSIVAQLYYEAGVERWGDKYDIVLAGGSLSTRSPYDLAVGDVMYGDLQSLLPFDNPLYLCKIKGSDLKSKFINNSSYTKYSKITASEVQDNEYYYIVADSWTALYAWARCTTVEIYDETTFARDLLAEYIKAGNWSK